MGRDNQENPHFWLEKALPRQCCQMWTLRSPRQCPVEPIVNEIVPLANIRGLEVDSNHIDELVEENNQELTTEELTELHCVSQQEVMEESLTEGEEVTAKQQTSSAIREMLKNMENSSSYLEEHHLNKAMAMCATNLFYDNAFRQILKHWKKQMSLDRFLLKKN
ncbi:hypothetical protein AVEN_176975-1 [Araneus ventricosus]|uniref:Uncharacterized protein n=1 Tax=Araneus ventricosus TaxID=182803 RepID=A0A4Y2PSG1_ARAVE|nr:hypothetical protein AVEN_176975-1 [Araneus ventricosus]